MSKKYKYSLLEHILFPKKRVNQQKLHASLANKTVLVTGATFGIGYELTLLLAAKDIKLILVGRTKSKLEEVQAEVRQFGSQAKIHAVDLREEDELAKFLSAIQEETIDVFVNNAGLSIRRSINDSLDRFHDYTRTNSINYLVPVRLTLFLIPNLKENKGQIINASAINVLFEPMPKWSAYQASKTASDQFFRSISPELQAGGIKLSTAYFPLVKTRMIAPTKKYENMPAMSPQQAAIVIAKLILKRKTKFKPWWTIWAETTSFVLKRPINFFNNRKALRNVKKN